MNSKQKLNLVLLVYVLGAISIASYGLLNNAELKTFSTFVLIWVIVLVPVIAHYRKLARTEKKES